jgi:NTP pyrophosphatase (non-canonical NTP hydrolase)
MNFKELMDLVFQEYVANGFADKFTENKEFDDLVEMALITTEVSEAIESLRNNDLPELGYECADIIIRVMNFCNRKGIDLERFILLKNNVNMKREKYHGKKII